MSRVRMKGIRELDPKALEERIQEKRTELAKLRTDAAKGTLRKESGHIRSLRRDIARMMTRRTELRKE